jgi:hypothetical protein
MLIPKEEGYMKLSEKSLKELFKLVATYADQNDDQKSYGAWTNYLKTLGLSGRFDELLSQTGIREGVKKLMVFTLLLPHNDLFTEVWGVKKPLNPGLPYVGRFISEQEWSPGMLGYMARLISDLCAWMRKEQDRMFEPEENLWAYSNYELQLLSKPDLPSHDAETIFNSLKKNVKVLHRQNNQTSCFQYTDGYRLFEMVLNFSHLDLYWKVRIDEYMRSLVTNELNKGGARFKHEPYLGRYAAPESYVVRIFHHFQEINFLKDQLLFVLSFSDKLKPAAGLFDWDALYKMPKVFEGDLENFLKLIRFIVRDFKCADLIRVDVLDEILKNFPDSEADLITKLKTIRNEAQAYWDGEKQKNAERTKQEMAREQAFEALK